MTWNFPRDEKLFASVKKANGYTKNAVAQTRSVDRRRARGVEPCAMNINPNAHTNLLGNQKEKP